MKTLLVTGQAAVPAPVREILERGSTRLVERRASDVPPSDFDDADRVVFWTDGTREDEADALASRYAAAADAERRDGIIAIRSDEAGAPPPGIPADAAFVWPRDEDRLKMAFLTGA